MGVASSDVGVDAGEPDLEDVLGGVGVGFGFCGLKLLVRGLLPEVVAEEAAALVDADGVASDADGGILGDVEESQGCTDPADGGDAVQDAEEVDAELFAGVGLFEAEVGRDGVLGRLVVLLDVGVPGIGEVALVAAAEMRAKCDFDEHRRLSPMNASAVATHNSYELWRKKLSCNRFRPR